MWVLWIYFATQSPAAFLYMSALMLCVCVCVCACLRMCVLSLWNATRHLDLLPLIARIPQPREKTHPISCDMAATSCRPVFYGRCPSHSVDWLASVCMSETEVLGSPVVLIPLHWWVACQDRDWDGICLYSERKQSSVSVRFYLNEDQMSDEDGKMWGMRAFGQKSAQGWLRPKHGFGVMITSGSGLCKAFYEIMENPVSSVYSVKHVQYVYK